MAVHGEGPKTMTLKAEGPTQVTAAMIDAGHDVEIKNPDLVICNLDAGAKINMELTVNTGKGYGSGQPEQGCGRSDRCYRG